MLTAPKCGEEEDDPEGESDEDEPYEYEPDEDEAEEGAESPRLSASDIAKRLDATTVRRYAHAAVLLPRRRRERRLRRHRAFDGLDERPHPWHYEKHRRTIFLLQPRMRQKGAGIAASRPLL